jgi:uncharacterized sulfatase
MKPKANLSKRKFLKTAASLSPAIGLAACSGGGNSSSSSSSTAQANYPYTAPTSTPNILFVIVDQLRYPVPPFPTTGTSINPAGAITGADQFMAAFMPKTYNGIWKNGVVFANNHVGATACGPARAAFVTGLYTQQTWNTATIATSLGNSPPWLDPAYPTYGKLLSSVGYDTPYAGKWHLSVTNEPHPSTGASGLAQFGFTGLTDYVEVDAGNLQGDYGNPPEGFQNDAFIADTAINWLSAKKASDKPWCLTVSFQNPHDYQFFPVGTEWQTFDTVFAQQTGSIKLAQAIDYGSQVVLGVSWANNKWKDAIDFGYNLSGGKVPNWESVDTLFATKPKWQTVGNQFNGLQFGAVSESSTQVNFSVGPYPARPLIYSYRGYKNPNIGGGVIGVGIGYAPYSYWQRGLNIYTYGMTRVDQQIGRVLDQLNALPAAVRNNTIVVFTSDHGELAGAHGFISNKTACVYDEAIRVPLVVYDPSNVFTGNTSTKRTQLTSHVDLAPMFMSFAYNGTFSWMKGDYATLYGQRFNMFPLLKSASASGRGYILFSTDESVDDALDFANAPDIHGNQTPFHVLGMVNALGKVGVYSNWLPGTANILTAGQEFEYYAENYTIEGNHSEVSNVYGSLPAGSVMAQDLLKNYVPNEMRAPLPASLASAQASAKEQLLAYYASQYSNSNINDSGLLITKVLDRV